MNKLLNPQRQRSCLGSAGDQLSDTVCTFEHLKHERINVPGLNIVYTPCSTPAIDHARHWIKRMSLLQPSIGNCRLFN